MTRLHDQFVDMTTGNKVVLSGINRKSLDDETVTYLMSDAEGNEIRTKDLTCFRFVGNDTPIPKLNPREIFIEDGKLFIGDKEVERGELYIEELLQVAEDILLLSVRARNKKNGSELFRYYVSNDKFLKLSQSTERENVEVSYERIFGDVDSDFICLKESSVISTEYSVEVEEKVETNIATQLFESAVFYEKCFAVETVYESLPGLSEIKHFKNGDDEEVLLCSFTETNKMVEENAAIFETVPREDGKALYVELCIKYEYDEETAKKELSFTVNILRDILFSKDISLTHDGRNSLLIIGEDSVVYSNNGYSPRVAKGRDVVKAVKAHPLFVALEPGTHHNTFVFANKNYETTRISVTKTNDRGFTTSIK